MTEVRVAALSIGLALCLGGCSRAADAAGDAPKVSALELDQMDIREGLGRYVSTRDDVKIEIPFKVDLAAIDPNRRHDSERIGQTDDGVIVLLDRYASKARPDGRCARGIESFVRAFSLPTKTELIAIRAESCLTGQTGKAAEVAWLAPDRFRVGTRIYIVRADVVSAAAVSERGTR